jgi:hypothetical protein
VTAQWLKDRQADWARAANLRTCPACHTTVLAGLDADAAALPIRCDPTPLDALGEAVALLQGRTTYDLIETKTGRELYERSAHTIKKPRRYQVFATHKCAESLAAFIQQPAEQKAEADHDRPQF